MSELESDPNRCVTAKCDYPEPHDHGFACGPYCPCGEGMQATKWRRFEGAVRESGGSE